VLWGLFPSFFIPRLLEDWKYFVLQIECEQKDYNSLDPLGRANFKYSYCNMPSSSFCKWCSSRHRLLNKSRLSQLHNGGRESMLKTLLIRFLFPFFF